MPDVQGIPIHHNTLGAPVLSRFRVTLDFPNKKAYFKPRTDLPDRDPPDAAGLLLRREASGTYIDDVRFDSPAQEAGLKIDDRLISVNGEDADKAAFFRLYEMLSQGGQSATLVYERKKQSQTVVLKLRHPIRWPPVWPEKKPIRKIPDEE